MEPIITLGGGAWPLFKRFRMERPTQGLPDPGTHPFFTLHPYQGADLQAHAEALAQSFADSDDRMLFPVLGSMEGCLELMREIVRRWDFVPGATWLASDPTGPVGTIQGLKTGQTGMVQNVGVVPRARNRGLGKLLLQHMIRGYARAGLTTVQLEVTANNRQAVSLYESMGFRCTEVLSKPAATNLV